MMPEAEIIPGNSTNGTMAEGTRANPIIISLMTCFYVDFPDTEHRTHCSKTNSSHCVHCPILGQFFTGESLEEYGGAGHVISLIFSVLGLIIAAFGSVTNVLIIVILVKQKSRRAFDSLLIALAWCDLFCCITAVITAVSIVVYFQNINRGEFNMYVVFIGSLSTLFGRSLSSFMTVLIALERYLVLVFPLKANEWFTRGRTRLLAVGVVIFSCFMAFPRFSSIYVSENEVGKYIPGMANFEYVFLPTTLEYFWYVTLGGFFDVVDFWLPLPLLLLFNGLVFFHIKSFERKRKELNRKVKNEINATKMFVPVVILLFLCNIAPILHFFFIISTTIYRELYCAVLLSLSVNSAANLPIYYFKGSSFRREVNIMLAVVFPKLVQIPKEPTSDTGATATNASKSEVDVSEMKEMKLSGSNGHNSDNFEGIKI